MTPQEEVELAMRIKKNDTAALNKLVNSNLRFVISMAKSYQNNGLPLEDLINEGNLGLMKAARRFDETRGFKFISYAVWWIRQSMLQAIAEKTRTIRLPLNRIGTLTKINKVYSRLEQDLERPPTADEVSDRLDIDSDDISDTVSRASRVVSLDSPPISGSHSRLVDIINNDDELSPDSALINNSLKGEITNILKHLTYREAKILKLYFGLDGEKPHTLEDVGRKFKLTRERIRQIKERALKKLLKSSHSQLLRQYL